MVNVIIVSLFIALIIGGMLKVTGIPTKNNLSQRFFWAKTFALGIIMITILSISNGAFFYGEAWYSYLVQYINGTQVVHTTPGYHFKGWWETIPFKNYITVKASEWINEQPWIAKASGRIHSIPIRFNDSVTADVSLSVRFQLPQDKEKFKKLALEFRSQENLVNATLIPAPSEGTRNSAKVVSAAEYMSGRGGDFDTSVLDQLQNGIYLLNSKTIRVKEEKEEEIIKDEKGEDIVKVNESRKLDAEPKVQYVVNIKRDKNGNPLRKDTVIKDLNIIVTQAIVDNIEPEPKFKELLAKQMSASANASIKKEEAKTAEWDRQTIIAKGETAKATIRVEQEKIQITKLITAETAKKESEIDLEKSKIDLEKAKINAQSTKTLADAEAYKKREIMKADGALEKKLATYEAVMAKYAEAMKDKNLVPQIYIAGDGKAGGSSASDFMSLMTASAAKDLGLNMNIPKTK